MDSTPSRRQLASHARGTYSGRPLVALLAAGQVEVAELGRDDHLVAPALDRLADQRLVTAAGIRIGGVEEVHAEIERALHGRDLLGIVAVTEIRGGAALAEPDGRHRQTRRGDRAAEPPRLHRFPGVMARHGSTGMVAAALGPSPCAHDGTEVRYGQLRSACEEDSDDAV
jgi:hypothetical protein